MLLIIQLNCEGFWAWPWSIILAFILGAILGWLLSKILGESNENNTEDYQQRYLDTKADLEICRKNAKESSLAGANALGVNSLTSKTVSEPIKAKKIAKKETVAVATSSEKDNLTKVEGIGPKIQGLLNDDGIWTWKQLSETAIDKIQTVLDNAGPRYRVHNPASWPLQAEMCYKGEWEKLKKWQDEHKGGRL